MALDGKSPNKIAETLTLKKIPIPIVHKKEPRAKDVTENDGYGIWKRQTIFSILTNQMYIGNMVQNTHNKISYNSKKLRKTDNSEHIIVPNTHEAIISKEIFLKVQDVLNDRTSERKTDEQLEYLLGGLLYCKDCGRSILISKDILKKSVRHYIQCNLYTRKGKFGVCSSHRVNYDWLEEDIIGYLQDICGTFCKHYDFNEVECNSESIVIKNIKEINRKIEKVQNTLNTYKTTIDSLYMDKARGLVDEDMYKRIYDKTKIEIKKFEEELTSLEHQREINEKQQDSSSTFSKCKKSVLDYMSLKTPTKDQITRLVEKVEIDKDKKIYVYLKFPELLI